LIAAFFCCIIPLDIHSQDWPVYNGPTGNYKISTLDATDYFEDFSYITPVWESEAEILQARAQIKRYNCGNASKGTGSGGSAPVYYNGKLYFYYYQPSGPWLDEPYVNSLEAIPCDTIIYDQWRLACKEVVMCIDAADGKTLWKTTFDEYFLYNETQGKHAAKNITLAAGDGKVFTSGISGMARALDATTGDSLWSTPLDSYTSLKNSLSTAISTKTQVGAYEDANSPAFFVDGIFIARDILTAKMYGFNPSSSTPLWSKAGVHTVPDPPQLLDVAGKKYLVCTSGSKITCIDPQNGNQQWQLTGVGHHSRTVSVDGEYMVINNWSDDIKSTANAKRGGYRINAGGYQFLWQFDTVMTVNNKPAIIEDGIVYQPSCMNHSPGNMYALDAETGVVQQVIGFDGQGSTPGTLFYFDGKIMTDADIAHGGSNVYRLIRTGVGTMEKLSQWGIDYQENAYNITITPCIINGRLYYRGLRHIYCYDMTEKVKNLDKIIILNDDLSMSVNQSYIYQILILDQYGVEYDSTVTVTWEVVGTGSVDQSGKYTAPASGGVTDLVIVTVSNTKVEVKDTAIVKVKTSQFITCHEFDSVWAQHPPFPIKCTASSGLPVTITKTSGPCLLSNDTITLLGVPGNVFLSITQPGNDIYEAAAPKLFRFYISMTEVDDTIIGQPYRFADAGQRPVVWMYDNRLVIKNAERETATVYSTTGIVYFSRMIYDQRTEINMHSLPPGLYIVVIADKAYKVLKQ
jgi:outer membrane protein assembly factor BamB